MSMVGLAFQLGVQNHLEKASSLEQLGLLALSSSLTPRNTGAHWTQGSESCHDNWNAVLGDLQWQRLLLLGVGEVGVRE